MNRENYLVAKALAFAATMIDAMPDQMKAESDADQMRDMLTRIDANPTDLLDSAAVAVAVIAGRVSSWEDVASNPAKVPNMAQGAWERLRQAADRQNEKLKREIAQH